MNRDIFEPWLSAERHGRDEEAEDALFELFAALPMPTPSEHFVDAVLARSGILGELAPKVRDLSRAWRWATAAAMACAALATAWILPLVLVLAGHVGLGAWLTSAVELIPGAARALADGLAFGRTAAAIVGAAWQVATTPQILLILTAMATTILVTGRRLSSLIGPRRSLSHAPFA